MKTIYYKNHAVEVCPDGITILCDGKLLDRRITGKRKDCEGYYYVYIEGIVLVRRLVAWAYIKNPKPLKYNTVASYTPQDSLDCSYTSLFWTSAPSVRFTPEGKRVLRPRSRLTLDTCIEIYNLRKQGKTQKALAKIYKVGCTSIQRALASAEEHHRLA